MSIIDMLFREKGANLSNSGYSAVGVADGGKKWGFAHHDKRAVEIATVRTIQTLAAAYTLGLTDSGKMFIVSGAVTVTLPAPSATYKGVWAEFMLVTDETFTLTGVVEKLVASNNASADSWALATTAEQIGSGARVFCDGALWYVIPQFANVAAAVGGTVTDA